MTSCRTLPSHPEEGDGEGTQRGDCVERMTEGESVDNGKGGVRVKFKDQSPRPDGDRI